MEETKEIIAESTAEHKKFDESLLLKKSARYDKIVKFVCLGLGIFSLVVISLLTIAFFFVGACKFFDVKFSLPAIAAWLDSLPSIQIKDAEGMLTKLILGAIFFIIYIFVAVILVKKLIHTINKFMPLVDINNSRIDHKQLLIDIVCCVSSTFSMVLVLTFLGRTTTATKIPSIMIVLLVFFGILYLAFLVGKNIYNAYDVTKGKFYKKEFAINVTKNLLIVLFATFILALCLSPELLRFVNNIIANYNSPYRFSGINFFIAYFMPIIYWFMIFTSILLFTITLKFPKPSTTIFNSYDKTYTLVDYSLDINSRIKSRTSWIIFFSILMIVLDIVCCCFNAYGEFMFPKNFGVIAKQITFSYLPVLLLAIAIKVVSKTKTKEMIPIRPIEKDGE